MDTNASLSDAQVALRRARARRSALLLGLLALCLYGGFIAAQLLHVHRG